MTTWCARDFTAERAEPAVADRHHRTPHRRGQALPLRDQGRLLQAHRRLLHRRPDEASELAVTRAAQRHRAARPRRQRSCTRTAAANSAPTPTSARLREAQPASARWAGSERAPTTPRWSRSSALLQKNVLNRQRWTTRERTAPGDRHLDREDLPPPPAPRRPRPPDPHRVRDTRPGPLTRPDRPYRDESTEGRAVPRSGVLDGRGACTDGTDRGTSGGSQSTATCSPIDAPQVLQAWTKKFSLRRGSTSCPRGSP